ncbi:MurR/RpiR family transcriptional regulator [Oceanobacillus neutriphilus]|uniref:HTH-type transcriptional regulator n=1 Tax=Oceanobacillus neutriphilus TaxID=531815 RepID=A0ABQ2NW41_9BACI|nr:MurR/RpiR family transcriptional regulator [Oceanobacillus neutriphilus]GGP12036.1 putative HTH-type transcriptional regulator [Oceanobacillus neutriphilus]
MNNDGLIRIREAMNHIKPAEKNAAVYILENPEEIVRLSIKELSNRSGSSQAAITRLCKNIGVSGFQDLKLRIAGDLQTSELNIYNGNEIISDENVNSLIEKVSQKNVESIRQTLKILEKNSVEEAIEALNNANRIDFYGAAASQVIAQDAQQKFLRINKYCTAYEDAHLQLTSSVTLRETDVAVGISYSGETKHVLSAIRNAKQNNAVTVAITRYGKNTLSELVDIHLCVSSVESDLVRSAATASRIAQLNIIDILFTGVASRNYDATIDYLNQTREALQREFRNPKKG